MAPAGDSAVLSFFTGCFCSHNCTAHLFLKQSHFCVCSGDFDTFSSIFEFYLQTLPFNSRRTQEYFNHTGIFYTETKTCQHICP